MRKRFLSLLKSILICLLLESASTVNAQGILEIPLDGSEEGKSLSTFISEIEQKDTVRFFFLPEWIEPFSFQQSYKGQTLKDVLDLLFQGTDISYFTMDPNALIFVKDNRQALLWKTAIETAIRQNKKIEPYTFGEPGNSQKVQITIKGRIIDSKTRQALPQVNIQVDTQHGTTTDENGSYTLTLVPGVHALNVSFIDYETKVIDLKAYEDAEINLEMEEQAVMLNEVVIRDQATREVSTTRIGQTQLSMPEIKRSPAMFGEADLIKQVQALPGVTTVGEAAAGFNVRGGSVDQNLILYDGMPGFNSSHVFGFLSAFNPEAIRDVTFIRGGTPAEYGGRASSVLDIKSKDGDLKKWNVNAGIGMITSNLMVNGPIRKEKTSVAASFRSTYSNWLVHTVHTDYADLSNSSVFFYDGTLKLTNVFNENTKLSLTGYASKDAFRLIGDSTYRWNNLQLSATVDHQFSATLNSEFVVGISRYGYSVDNDDAPTASELSYQITSSVLKAGFNYQRGNHKLNFGWQFLHYKFDPGTLKPTSPESNARNISLDDQYSIENAFYLADAWALNDRLFVEAGVRIPMFTSFGAADINVYRQGSPREVTTVTDTLHFSRGETIKTYFGFEPRLSFRWMLSPTASFKLGYNRMYQFLHLVTNTTAVTPVDIWQPSGYYFKPQVADQLSLGYFKDIKEKKYNVSAEVFYKTINNILDFKDGAQLIMNKHLETDLLQGKGESYGIETAFTKNTGRLSGSFNYTYSRSFRIIAGPTTSESINQGNQYPSSFDQPHILNLSWKYNITSRYFFTGNFTYHTGRPVTIPLSIIALENTSVAYFSGRNQYRIPDYHRLDVALVIEGTNKRSKKWVGTWVFSIYNLYGRKNPYTVFFKDSGNGVPKPYQLSIIGTVFPSVSYNIKF